MSLSPVMLSSLTQFPKIAKEFLERISTTSALISIVATLNLRLYGRVGIAFIAHISLGNEFNKYFARNCFI